MESTSVVLDQPLEKTVKILGFSVSVINVELYKSYNTISQIKNFDINKLINVYININNYILITY